MSEETENTKKVEVPSSIEEPSSELVLYNKEDKEVVVTTSPKEKGFDPEWDGFTFDFCFNEFLNVINKAKLYIANSTSSPDWFKYDFKEIQNLQNTTEDSDFFKHFFRNFFLENDDDFLNDLTIDNFTLPIETIVNTMNEKSQKRKVVQKNYCSDEFLFYFAYCIYNSLEDEDEGNDMELWNSILKLSNKLEVFYDHKGPSNFKKNTEVFLKPQFENITNMASQIGINTTGSTEAFDSFQKIINKAVSNFGDVKPPTSPNETIDTSQICSKISETFSDKEIQTELQNVLNNGKKLFENNMNNGNLTNTITTLMNTFMNIQQK